MSRPDGTMEQPFDAAATLLCVVIATLLCDADRQTPVVSDLNAGALHSSHSWGWQ